MEHLKRRRLLEGKKLSNQELESMDAFLDFLKGLLRIDPATRWTPSMAMKHPFISRVPYKGPFEPPKDEERVSTGGGDTLEETGSEHSSSSRDS
jgi:serine/threonine protein kinase